MRHPTRREEYDDQQSAIAHTRHNVQTTPKDHPAYADRLNMLRISYRNLIEIAPARDRAYWIAQRDEILNKAAK